MIKRIMVILLLVVSLCIITACTIDNSKTDDPIVDPSDPVDPVGPTDEEIIDAMIEKMSVKEKITQMIMIAARTYEKDNGSTANLTVLTDDLSNLLNKYAFGGVILFAQNCSTNTQTYKLIHDMQVANSSNASQLLVSVDQEGGRVVRLEEGTQFSGNMGLGAVNDVNETSRAASIIGQELRTLGFNSDFAPVVDVNNNPSNPVIGTRSFSDDPNMVATHGTAFMNGLKSANIIATLKHFPGHGDTATDSHSGLPLINKTYEELMQNELIPYVELINNGVDMIMTAHIQYSKIETTKYISKSTGEEILLPATLSKTIITDILRGKLGYKGVVITDAMEMAAIAKHFNRYDAAKLAIEAGVDMLLMPTDLGTKAGFIDIDTYIDQLVVMVESGDISIEKINAANKRILTLKQKYGLLEKYEVSDEDYQKGLDAALNKVGSKENHEIEFEIASKAITLLKNDNCLPLSNQKMTAVVTLDNTDYLGVKFGKVLSAKNDHDFEYTITNLSSRTLDNLKSDISSAEQVIIFSQMGNSSFITSSTVTKIKGLIDYCHSNNKKVVILSTNLPYDAALYENADAIVLAYSPKTTSVIPDDDYTAPVKQYGPNIPMAISKMFDPNATYSGKVPVNIYKITSDNKYDLNVILYNRGFGLTN